MLNKDLWEKERLIFPALPQTIFVKNDYVQVEEFFTAGPTSTAVLYWSFFYTGVSKISGNS